MIAIFFLCVKLTIFHLCVSDLGYQCESDRDDWSMKKPAITLIKDYNNDYFNIDFIVSFRTECQYFYDINTKSKYDYSREIKQKDQNVIYFAVPEDFDKKLLENFEYAGNISDANDAVCNNIGDSELKYNCHERPNLVSSSVRKLNDGDLYDYVQRMKKKDFFVTHRDSCKPSIERKTSNLMIVVVCLDETVSYGYPRKVNIKPLKLIVTKYYCRRELYLNNDRLLAVLAPKPFEVYNFTEYSVPTIFYDIPYIFSENKIAFPNSMNLIPWRLLKYGFLKFIQTMGWQRVLIVTDDSAYSLEFEDELIALFNKERMVYTVIRCEDANCEMNKIKQELNRVSAKIVIGNVEEEHAKYLFENAHENITWIVRDMAKSKIQSYNKDVFSISLRSVNKTNGCDFDENILTGLSSIALAYKNIAKEDYDVKINEFYRRFAVKVEQIRKMEAIVVVNKLDTNFYYNNKEISTMYVNESGAELLTFKDPYGSDKPSDGTTHCFAKSYDYFKPCEDTLIILFMFIILLFIISFLLIICYFQKSSPINNLVYQNFK